MAAFLLGCAGGSAATATLFDFTELSSDGLPLGWSVVSYENRYDISCDGGVLTISTTVADDCRLVHKIPVSGSTRYVFEADVQTDAVFGGQGATLSVDNYSLDGSYIYSEGVYGTNDWTHIELAFLTDAKQDTVQLALRLGGYSSQTSGTVRFCNVSVRSADTANVSFQRLSVRSASDTASDKTTEQYEGYFSLIFWETVLAAAVLLYGVYRNRDRIEQSAMTPKRKWILFAVIVAVGLVIRLSLCATLKGHATDMNCWIAWGNQIADGRLSTFYDGTWYDYPPGYMLVLGALTLLLRLFGVTSWGGETLIRFCYMLPAFLCDIGCGVLALRFAEEQKRSEATGLLLCGLVILNPAVMYLSGAWGQIDSILTFLLLLAFDAFRKDRRILCGLWFGLAVLTKWQALIYGPVLAIAYLATLGTERDGKRRGMDVCKTILAVIVALLLILAVSLPFRGSMSLLWIVERFLSASSGYDYATVEGYNFFALLGANWRNASIDIFNGAGIAGAILQTLNVIGKLLLPTALCTLLIASWQEFREKQGYYALTALGFTGFASIIIYIVAYAFPKMESAAWMLYGAMAAIGLLGWMLQHVPWKQLKSFVSENDTAFYGTFVALSACGVCVLMFVLWLLCGLFGFSLTYTAFGTLMIALSLLGAGWIFFRFAKASRLNTGDPELLYLSAACFMAWVFTFGHYMHERYVIPVLILLLFVYAASQDRRVLLSMLLLTVSTFLNEMVAMYVVSEGAINAIRGGDRHNLFLAWCSTLEVLAALYLTVSVVKRLSLLGKGGDAK